MNRYSPDLNPIENIWPIAEKKLRKEEPADETEASFQRRVPRTVESYAQGSAKKLIPSMAARIEEVIEKKGGLAKY